MNYVIQKGILEDAKNIRIEVFVDEQKFQEEFDEVDANATHIVVYDEDKAVATCRFFPVDETTYKLGRIAVVKSYRGKNIGRYVMEIAEKEIKKLGGKVCKLGAQLRAKGFYEKCGYTSFGEIYQEEYCDHIMMKKILE